MRNLRQTGFCAIYTLACVLLTCVTAAAQKVLPYKDSTLSIDVRVKDLLSRMTPEEKFWQLFMIPGDLDNMKPGQYQHGIFGLQVSASGKGDETQQILSYNTEESGLMLVRKINNIQKYFVEKTRLGIPIIAFDESLHGLVREGATSFPQAIALAATFDTTLMRKVATAIALETRARGIRQVLSPVVNIASDVRWGRVEETYGEDPFLTSAMAVAFVRSFEKMGVITTPKHFVANVGDGGRDSYPIHFSERFLEEVHFPPFRACFEHGGSRSVMTSYNSLDGTPSSLQEWLLTKKLKGEWNFKGFVISDANATGGAVVLHRTAADYPESGKHAISGGMDVIFQTDYDHYKLFAPGILDKGMDQARIDDAVSRVLRAKFELGLFEKPYVDENVVVALEKQNAHKALAKEAALKSIVLLKNANKTLPLKKDIKTIAVIGEDAVEARLGGYSGPGNKKVSILDGIKERATGFNILYAEGCKRLSRDVVPVEPEFLSFNNTPGLQAEYFDNIELKGMPVVVKRVSQVDFMWTLSSPDPLIVDDFYSARWTGKIKSPKTGTFKIGLEGNDGFRLYVDNKLLIDNWTKRSYSSELRDFYFEKEKSYDIRVEFFEPVGNARIRLVWDVTADSDGHSRIEEAVNTARQADVAIVVAGIHEGEFQDRALLSLPGRQEELIQAIAATGKPVVVVLVGGSAVTMSNWIDKVNSIVNVWYPGEEGGHAVASVLFGDYNPAGRLPITFPVHEGQLPLVYNHKPTGRGDDYYNLTGLPLFPFGYGLSYTTFEYSDIILSKGTISVDETTTVRFTVKNTGSVAGDEVCQLYIRDMLASVARPVMELKGFQRIHLEPGETRELHFEIGPELLRMLDKDLKEVVEPGAFKIMIGASSRDIRLTTTLNVTK
jgi:beta-glucosidase